MQNSRNENYKNANKFSDKIRGYIISFLFVLLLVVGLIAYFRQVVVAKSDSQITGGDKRIMW